MVQAEVHRRREFLKLAAFGLAGMTTTSLPALGQAQRDTIQRPETPERALSLLVEGNQRFVAQNLVSFREDLDILKAHSEEHQEPFAAVLSCADSRVPVELVFDQSIGHLFVVRVAGNIATPDTIASLEYGAAVLGVKAILARSKRPSLARRYRAKSAPSINTFIPQLRGRRAISRSPAGKMPACRHRC
jgi:carbonic anhydrase